MPGLKSTKNKHLTMEERQEIMECLDKGMSFKDIARRIGKAVCSTGMIGKNWIKIRGAIGSMASLQGENPTLDSRYLL